MVSLSSGDFQCTSLLSFSLFRLLQQNTSGWCLRNSRNLLITPHGCVLAKALFRLLTQTRCVLTGWKGREVSSLFEETSPIHEDRADHPPKAPLPNTITWWGGGGGIGISTYEFVRVGRRGTQIFRAQRWNVEEEEF